MPTCSKCRRTTLKEDMVTSRGKPTTRCKNCNRKEARKHYALLHGSNKERKDLSSTLLLHIKHLRKKGWTLKQIANDTGLDASSISYYLRGERSVGMYAVKKWKANGKRR